ncbi:MAG: phage terminase large subunit family protein [Terriglobales bacterium]
MTPNHESKIFERAARALRPPPRWSVSQWADQSPRYLSPESSAEPGPWSTARAPFQRDIMDAINDPTIETVVIMSSAQIGKTEIINNLLGYFIDQDPSPVLVVMPTLEIAHAWSKDRLSPMLRDTPCLRGRVKEAKAKVSNNTMLHKKFPGGHLTIAGANSPSSLASRPIRIVCCDEVDKYPPSAGAEGDPVNLAFKRTTTFWNRRHIMVSTPTIKGASRIESAYESSDQRHFNVPCPHCNSVQVLKWRNVTWPTGHPEEAIYACEHCGVELTDADKPEMLRRGVWVAEKPGSSTAGFHVNELYSPWVTWPQMAKAFLEAKKLPETLKTWINTSLGETWEQEGESVDDGTLFGRREEYAAQVPQNAIVLTAGIDVQEDRLEVEVVAWGISEECWSVDYHTFRGNPAMPDVWSELDEYLSRTFEHESGVGLRIACALVDSGGHHTKQVYAFCRRRQTRRIYACKGFAGAGKPLAGRPTKGNQIGALLFPVGVDTAKELIYSRLRLTEFGPGFCHFPEKHEYDREYFSQLTAEKLKTKYKNGFPTKYWEKTRPRNEALDCRVYAMAALDALKPNLPKIAESLAARANDLHKKPEPLVEKLSPLPPQARPTVTLPRRQNWVNSWRW